MFITPSFLLVALAVFIAVILIPGLLYPKQFQKAIKDICSDTALMRVTGLFGMLIAFLFLSVHWKFNGGWFIIIPILGWSAFLKSLSRLLFPEWTYKITKKYILKSEAYLSIMSFIGLLFAIFLVYVTLNLY